jgi:hypothetical protein
MKNTKQLSGAGGAHIGYAMFGARGPLRSAEDDGGGSTKTTFSLEEVQAMKSEWQMQLMQQKDARIAALESQLKTPAAEPQPERVAAAAPSPPSKVEPHMSNGLVNIFALKPEQIAQYTPSQLREKFEQILGYAREQSGMPRTPSHPNATTKGRGR